MEIERKYLPQGLPDWLELTGGVEIEQAYLCTSPTLRIRRMGDDYILTVKQRVVAPSSAIHHREEEFMLDNGSYSRLLAKREGNVVSKTRYKVPIGGLVAEIDVFHGVHDGLVLVEVEFPDTEAADAFTPPAWFGREVSGDRRFTNAFLAMNGATIAVTE